MNIQLAPVKFNDKSILRHLLELYQYDISEFTLEDVNENGFYEYKYLDHYWTEPGRFPFFIVVEGQYAGFALIRKMENEHRSFYSMAEFFVMKKFRTLGVGRKAAFHLFKQYQESWELVALKENHNAQKFWKTIICQYTDGHYKESENVEGDIVFSFPGHIDSSLENVKEDLLENHSFRRCLDGFIEAWKKSSIIELTHYILKDYQAREIRQGEIMDYGYVDSINGWEQGFHYIQENNGQWAINEHSIIPLGEDEIIAILSATIVVQGIPLKTANLFIDTFRKVTSNEWKLVRSYIEAGISIEKVQV